MRRVPENARLEGRTERQAHEQLPVGLLPRFSGLPGR